MKLKLAAAVFAPSAAAVTGAAAAPSQTPTAIPSLAYAVDKPTLGADVIDAKFKFKKFRSHSGFGRSHFRGRSFGGSKFAYSPQHSYAGTGIVKKSCGKFFFGKGFSSSDQRR